jgi:hypothetical protein
VATARYIRKDHEMGGVVHGDVQGSRVMEAVVSRAVALGLSVHGDVDSYDTVVSWFPVLVGTGYN